MIDIILGVLCFVIGITIWVRHENISSDYLIFGMVMIFLLIGTLFLDKTLGKGESN